MEREREKDAFGIQKSNQPKTTGLELGGRGAWPQEAVRVAEAQHLGLWYRPRGVLLVWSVRGALHGFQK